jgi:hypothetical protein
MIRCRFKGNIPGHPGNDHSQFAFIVNLGRHPGVDYLLLRTDYRGRWFQEEQGLIGDLFVRLLGMIAIVKPNGNDLPGFTGGQQVYLLQSPNPDSDVKFPEYIAPYLLNLLSFQETIGN